MLRKNIRIVIKKTENQRKLKIVLFILLSRNQFSQKNWSFIILI